jgi:hypothetical protein
MKLFVQVDEVLRPRNGFDVEWSPRDIGVQWICYEVSIACRSKSRDEDALEHLPILVWSHRTSIL